MYQIVNTDALKDFKDDLPITRNTNVMCKKIFYLCLDKALGLYQF